MMNGKRLGRFALSPPLRHRRTLRPPITLLHQITSELSPRCLRPSSLGLKTGVSERTFYVGARHTSSERSSSLGAGHMARGRANRAYLAVGGMVAFLAVVLLAREGQLPESFAEWDDKLVWEEIYDLAQLSNMTTKTSALITRWFEGHGYTGGVVVRELYEASTRYFVHAGHLQEEEHSRVHHVAIRGTVSLKELSINLKTRLVFDEECGCNLHEGFKGMSDSVADDIEQFLEPGAEIKVCGHSLGGAIAVIVAAKLKRRGHNVVMAMTFGAPMVTDAPGAKLLRQFVPVLRVTHETDLIPLGPLTAANVLPSDGWSSTRAERGTSSRNNREGTISENIAGLVVDGRARGKEQDDHDGVFSGKERGVATNVQQEQSIGPRTGYSHFGSQLVLLRSSKCIECRREENPPGSLKLQRRGTIGVRTWDDIWGPPPGPISPPVASDDRSGCEHCPSRGTSYYDPKGEEGSFFDSPWIRLTNITFTHRMRHYESEVFSRLEQHRLRRHQETNEASSTSSPFQSSPAAEDATAPTPVPAEL
ncbi:unnamed protein product [Ascophyllum nodosum]